MYCLLTLPLTACAAGTHDTSVPEGGAEAHQAPRPQASLGDAELERPDPQADIRRGTPPKNPEYLAVIPPMGGGVEVDANLLEACDMDRRKTYFEFDSARLSDSAEKLLDDLVLCYSAGKIDTIEVEGFTDPRGSTSYNEDLGMDRAESVGDYLSSRGLPVDAMILMSNGEDDASAKPSLWPKDRRVELRLAD